MENNNMKLTKQDIRNSYIKWRLFAEVSHSFERYQALALTASIASPLRKLYQDNEEFIEALERHMQFFNTEATVGAIIPGMVLSMEEDRANGKDIPAELISTIKTGLMGPMAGIGDTLVWGTIKSICFALATTLAMSGNLPGTILMLAAFPITAFTFGFALWKSGYSLGRTSVNKLLESGKMNKIIQSCSIIGLMMMGALSASYVYLKTTAGLAINNSDPIIVQNMLDEIIPGLLPLAAIAIIYYCMKKKTQNFNIYVIAIVVLCLVGAFFDIV
ncbi:MAG: PTS system mannose/fructose/sorbose family transporter subunit IID [Erysipelotrichaceae bacterium]